MKYAKPFSRSIKQRSFKRMVVFALAFLLSHALNSQEAFFNNADQFLKQYTFNGLVDYQAIQKNPKQLDHLLEHIENYNVDESDRSLAFYINAYNILVINQLVQEYPVESPQEIQGFFDANSVKIAGKELSLNQLENDVIRSGYNDPRVHFVLVCGALGCPPLTNFAYRPQLLNEQLEQQTRNALNDSNFIRINDDMLGLSEIFQWYEDDFLQNSNQVIDFINSYRIEKIDPNTSYSYYVYNWSINDLKSNDELKPDQPPEEVSNIFAYTPSRLLKKKQIEMQLFNNLYTQTAYRDGNRDKVNLETRDTYYSALYYALVGVAKSARINAGFDLNLKSVLIDSTKSSPLNVFRFQQTPYSRTAVTSIGPKIKFQPFRNLSNFSIQSAFWFPVAKDLESIDEVSDYPWMDYHMYTWWNQFFFDKTFGSKWQLFSEADLLFRFKTGEGNIPSHVDIPVSVFLSWFPGRKTTIYYQIQYSPRIQLEDRYSSGADKDQEPESESFDLISDFAHTGLGLKYQLTTNLNLEASSTYFFNSMNGGAGATFNLGFRFIL